MKNISLLILVLICFSTDHLNAQSPVIDSIVVRHCFIRDIGEDEYNASIVDSFSTDDLLISTTQFDSVNSIIWKENYTYSSTGKIVHDVNIYFIPAGGSDSLVKTYTYNSDDSLVDNTELRYYSGSLYGGSRTIIHYDTISLTRITYSQICDSSGIWNLQSQILDSFNITGNLIRRDFASSNGTISMTKWFEYLPNDSVDLYYFLDQSAMSQSDSGMYNYSYDSLGYLISIEKILWDSASASFGNPDAYWGIYYDSTHTLIGKSSGWYLGIPGAQWELWDTTYYQYDALQRLIYENESLIPHCGNWTEYTYYAGTNNIDSVNYCRWCTHSGNCSFCKYEYFSLILDVNEDQKERFTIFPNPANSKININLPQKVAGYGNVIVTDLQSKIVYQKSNLQLKASFVINDLDLLPGIYFITIANSDFTGTQKLLITK